MARGYAVRVPGPDDLWMVCQDGGELGMGTVAGYGSDHLRHLIVLLTEALVDVERAEMLIEARAEARSRESGYSEGSKPDPLLDGLKPRE
jgi:hypothetical protein